MGRFEEFELAIKKIRDFPVTYETIISEECSFFQDVRRYQSITSHLDVKVIAVDGIITLEPDMCHVPMSKLTSAEKKEFIDYLKIRVSRGDNVGSSWAFFRPRDKKKVIIAYGANIVHRDSTTGLERARRLLATLQGNNIRIHSLKRMISALAVLCLLAAATFSSYKYLYLENRFPFKSHALSQNSPEMDFYKAVFPQVYQWKTDERPFTRKIADTLLRPEYVTGLLASMDQDFYREKDAEDHNLSYRLALFVYFNYNTEVAQAMKRYQIKLNGTEFFRLANIYSTKLSGYSSNIFYFKVGDLDLKHTEISNFLTQNMITYRDYTKLRDVDEFSELLEKDGINYKMKNFLEDVYTFTPLRIKTPLEGIDWYLLTQTDNSGNLDFAAFFQRDKATLVPRLLGDLLLNTRKPKHISWFGISESQATQLKLSDKALTYFTKSMGQALKLDVVNAKISELKLKPIDHFLPVTVHRELLMGDSKGKYGIQSDDPIRSMVLSNLISKSSFERDNKVSLKRDPIQVNTTLVQLSKDDSFSTQSITITPGKTGIIKLFKPVESFKGRFRDGQSEIFEKATVNLFNPFSFMVFKDSITFSFKHEITDMELDLGGNRMKIIKSDDGNHQIIVIQ
ncbi:hypothetical protein [Desulfobacula sp.]|uniref:hypothetical protein n=1 Tax=Desulfobacula sp. TaxID=2593537 RepID=UPI00262A3E29|nr:hypothetical protein [Desulfobacula sp.]